MTTLNITSQIPSNINTVERLVAWGGYLLKSVNPTAGVLETEERAERVAQTAIFQAADGTTRLLIRACLPLNANYATDRTIKLWMHTEEFSSVAIPTGFLSN